MGRANDHRTVKSPERYFISERPDSERPERILIGESRTKRDGAALDALGRHFGGVVVLRNGRELAERAIEADKRGEPFDVIVVALGMPDMDGYSAASLIRENGIKQPIIAISGRDNMGYDELASHEAGCNCCLTRSDVPERLVPTIEELLEQ